MSVSKEDEVAYERFPIELGVGRSVSPGEFCTNGEAMLRIGGSFRE